jgi:CheY-like chemotaxis protein
VPVVGRAEDVIDKLPPASRVYGKGRRATPTASVSSRAYTARPAPSPAVTARALKAGAHTVLTKPCSVTDLLAAVRAAMPSATGADLPVV